MKGSADGVVDLGMAFCLSDNFQDRERQISQATEQERKAVPNEQNPIRNIYTVFGHYQPAVDLPTKCTHFSLEGEMMGETVG